MVFGISSHRERGFPSILYNDISTYLNRPPLGSRGVALIVHIDGKLQHDVGLISSVTELDSIARRCEGRRHVKVEVDVYFCYPFTCDFGVHTDHGRGE